MIEGLGIAARALGVLASSHLIGTAAFLLLADAPSPPVLRAWARRWSRSLLPGAAVLSLALVAALLVQAAQVAGATIPIDAALLRDLVTGTRFGRIWLWRALLAVALVSVLIALRPGRDAPASRSLLMLTLLAAAAVAIAAPLTGHAAGSAGAFLRVPAHMLHVLALCLWLGALPAWIGLVRVSRRDAGAVVREHAARVLLRFSRLALLCMIAIVLSGALVAWAFVDDQGDLLGTRYGLLLVAKLLLLSGVLRIASRLRAGFVPSLRDASASVDHSAALRLVGVELGLALGLLLLGAGLAQTTPALHDQPLWWLPWRVSVEATWPQWPSMPLVLAGAVLLAAAVFWRRRRIAASALGAGGLALVAWALSVPAFPDTFRRADVPYLAESIANGQRLFETHCVSCHGRGGLGYGVRAAGLAVPPANLSEPHTALHTAGDMYWWFSHGIPASGMPGYADRLDGSERWDLVNFLRAFSQGFEARVLGPRIQPLQPWLGAPLFYFDDVSGGRADLKDFRRRSAVLLVFLDGRDPAAGRRLAALDAARPRLAAAGLQVIAIAIAAPTQLPALDIPVLGGDAALPVWSAYQLLSRTLADRGDADRLGMAWHHAEFLIDRFGYVRARWIPQDTGAGWDDLDSLLHQIERLQSEPELRPPPDLHIH
ncbi:MAG: CopD family protein [Sinimarinibacterium sp.]|jgi:putative copper resistance protein D